MTLTRRLPILAAALLLLGLAGMPVAHAAEEQTVKVFSAFQAQGQFMKTGDHEATFIGMIAGPVYFDTDQGPVDGGTLSCPIVVHINLKDATQKGTGQCVFTGPKGNQAYMELTCTGVPLVGCNGDSTFTGGTGPFAGVGGGGSFVLRSSLQEIRSTAGLSFQDTARGIIYWRALHYKIP